MIESLPRVEIYADTFPDSTLLHRSIHDVFESSLHFWMKACKFYRRHRLFNLLRSTWNNYDIEFSRLEIAMKNAVDRVEKGGIVEHIKEAKAFRAEQQLISGKAFELKQSEALGNMIRSLSPNTGDVDYYMRDYESAQKLRHPGTCGWILENDTFSRWSKTSVAAAQPNLLLWINGGPGMGKTVLSAAIIDHLRSLSALKENPILIYFYFKGFSDKNNPSAAVLSFLYQILVQNKNNSMIDSKVSKVFGVANGASNSEFDSLWNHFCGVLEELLTVTIVLDGLDECSDSKTFVKNLLNLSKNGRTRIVITSRREKHFVKQFETCQSLEITPEHVQKDIKTFVEFKITRSPRLSNPLVIDLIEEKLIRSNFGMFLWVRLVLKELKACMSVEQVQHKLAELPKGLEAMYLAVVQRLEKTLTSSAVEVARKVLAWAIGSARSISFDELTTALSYQYKLEGQTLLYEDSTFPYSEKDIELMCGSLIVIRNGQVQPAHYTVKSYMLELGKKLKARSVSDITLLPDLRATSLDLAAVCVTYFAEKSSLLSAKRDILDRSGKSNNVFEKKAFLGYSCIYWTYHTLDCPIEWGNDMAHWLTDQFTSPAVTCNWLEESLLLDRKGLWRLAIGIEELEVFFCERREMDDASEDVSQMCEWCTGIRNILDHYGAIFMEFPSLIQTLELGSFYLGKPSKSLSESGSENEREVEIVLHESRTPTVSDPDFERTHLGYEGYEHFNLWKAELGFFVYDPNQDVFFSGEKSLDAGLRSGSRVRQEWLFVQQATTGKRLPPVAKDLGKNVSSPDYSLGSVIAAKVSPDGRFFVIAYDRWLSVWVIERDLMFQQSRKATQRLVSHNWASRLMVCPYPDSTVLTESDTDASIIAFSPGNRLFVPGGWFNLPSREFCPFGLEEFNPPASPMLYSGNGAYLFRLHRSALSQQVVQYQINNTLRYSPNKTFNVEPQWEVKPSNTGAFLVLFGRDIEADSVDISLMECNSSTLFDISEGKAHFGHRSFYFSKDDGQLVTFLRGPQIGNSLFAEITVTVWKLSSEGPKKRSEGSIRMAVKSCESWRMNPPLFAMRSDNFAWIVTCHRSIYFAQFDFSSVSFPGRKLVDQYLGASRRLSSSIVPRPLTTALKRWHTELLQDGSSLANVLVGDSEVRVRVLSLSGNRAGEVLTDEVYRLPSAYKPSAKLPVSLNMHFDTLVIGAYAFIIGIHNSPPIKLDIDIDKIIRNSWFDAEWECKISCCGSLVAFVRPGGRDLGELAIFRIDRSTLDSCRLDIIPAREAVLKNLDIEVRSIEFHQSLPTASVMYNLREGHKRGEDYHNLKISDLVTCTIHFKKPTTLESPPFQRFWNSEYASRGWLDVLPNFFGWGSEMDKSNDTELGRRRDSMIGAISPGSLEPQTLVRTGAGFSACGSFICLPCSEFRGDTTGRLLLSDISFSPRPLKVIGNRTVINASKSRSYMLRIDKGLVWVEMHEYEALPDNVKLPYFQKTKGIATAKYITAYPDIWSSYNLDACLLLGGNYDEHVRFCMYSTEEFVPVLKILTVSWNDVLRKLEKELAIKN